MYLPLRQPPWLASVLVLGYFCHKFCHKLLVCHRSMEALDDTRKDRFVVAHTAHRLTDRFLVLTV